MGYRRAGSKRVSAKARPALGLAAHHPFGVCVDGERTGFVKTNRDPMISRMLGALRLDLATYEEIEADKKATGQAAYIVVASSLVTGAVSFATTGEGTGFGGA